MSSFGLSARLQSDAVCSIELASRKLRSVSVQDVVSYKDRDLEARVRCPRCGNENPEAYRFCGMCGTSLLQAPSTAPAGASSKPPIAAPAAGTVAGATRPAAPAPRAQAPPSEEYPIISGPSFLGLNQPPPSPQRKATLSIDPHGPSSGNLDYLLEDEEHPKGGAGKFILIVVALALAVGFGYLRWRNQGLPFLGSRAVKPSAATESTGAADASSPAPSSASSSAEAPGSSQPGAVESPGAAAPTASSATPPATPTTGATQPGPAPAGGGTGGDSDSAAAAQPSTAKNSTAAAPDVVPATTEKVKPAPKPRAADRPLRAADPVAEAQKYIYGKGVRQDCDRGLRLLKPVADQANPKAMIEMGALYSAGLCTPRDLPTSYRWFALALRKDPNNQSLQADLNKLWGEMTQPERQLAIKLSQ